MHVNEHHTYVDEPIKIYFPQQQLLVGKYCSISQGVEVLLGGEHHTEWISTYPFNTFHPDRFKNVNHPASKGNVIVGNDVWIGMGAKLLSGVTIGHGAVVGAFSVVTRDVPAYTKVAGNPARDIGKRFSDDHISRLLAIQWWNWPEDKILAAAPLLQSSDLEGLFQFYDQVIRQA